MDRRKFCKIGALSLGVLGLSRLESMAMSRCGMGVSDLEMPRSCRVTVMRCECYVDLQSEYLDDPEAGTCRDLRPGMSFDFVKGQRCPSDFCSRAWNVLVGAVKAGVGCEKGIGDVMMLSCPDGSRPVIFKASLR